MQGGADVLLYIEKDAVCDFKLIMNAGDWPIVFR
jgi:hypothetical protein